MEKSEQRSRPLAYLMAFFGLLFLGLACGSSEGALPSDPSPTLQREINTPVAGISGAQASATPAAPYVAATNDEPEHLGLGASVFAAVCAGCHGSDGQGTARAPTLIGVAEKIPDRARIVSIVTWGAGEMNGKGAELGIPNPLTVEEIDAVVSYVRLTMVGDSDT